MNPTAQQIEFRDAAVHGYRNIALVARAGTGKTSTILLTVDALAQEYRQAEIVVLAYNKAIADEVKGKLQKMGHNDWRRIQAATLHSLGFGLLKYMFKLGDNSIDDKKVHKLISQFIENGAEPHEQDVVEQYRAQVETLVRYAKQAGFGFFPDVQIGSHDAWYALADHFDVNGLEETDQMDIIVNVAQKIYRASLNQTAVIDFDDMILFPLIKNIRVRFGKDFIFLDESQDLSRTRQALARKFLKVNGRMFIVGDDKQAIYGFSGADSAALENMIAAMNAIKMPLNVTWRCPAAVVREAQKIVPDIQAAPNAIEGVVRYANEYPEDLTAGDAILCRNTAPLIKEAYSLIRQGKAAKVEGRAIGDGLDKLAGRWKVNTIAALLTKLEDYREREVQKAIAKNQDSKAEEVADRVDCVVEICNACLRKGQTSVYDVKNAIADLFGDDVKGAITLATYHRSKGREWQRVILFEHHTRCPSKAARQEWQKEQEQNLAYVAITRAQRELIYFTPAKKEN